MKHFCLVATVSLLAGIIGLMAYNHDERIKAETRQTEGLIELTKMLQEIKQKIAATNGAKDSLFPQQTKSATLQ
jgi:hypothetical protein